MDFLSEKLTVDWIAFNLEDLEDEETIRNIANYLSSQFRINSRIRAHHSKEPKELVQKPQNHYKAEFFIKKDPRKRWKGTILNFTGNNANYFYRQVQARPVNWHIFDLEKTNIGRFDLKYFRDTTLSDISNENNLELFMEGSCQKVRSTNKLAQASWGRNNKGLILKIGKRGADNYFRVYEVNAARKKGLAFELEMKRHVIRSFQKLFFSGQIENFEKVLVEHFYKQSSKKFVFNSCYTDWFEIGSRKLKSHNLGNLNQEKFLVTSYIKDFDSIEKQEYLYRFLQFLSYIRQLDGQKIYIEKQLYYTLKFTLSNFIEFIGGEKTSHYQRKKLLSFLAYLQNVNPMIQHFYEKGFRRACGFPYFECEKKGRSYIVTILISEELRNYHYPFYFTGSFLTFRSKYDLCIKISFIKAFSKTNFDKIIPIEQLLNNFSVSNSQRKNLKKLILELIYELESYKEIEPQITLVGKSIESVNIEDLTIRKIGSAQHIIINEIIK